MKRRKQDFFEPDGAGPSFEDEVLCLVFRTSLQNRSDVENISIVLDNLAGISDWHIDLDDWEKVLRIECTGLSADDIIKILKSKEVITEEIPTEEL